MLLPLPAYLLFMGVVASGRGNGDPVVGTVVIGLLTLLPVGFAFLSSAFIRVSADTVRVGFSPMARSKFRRADVEHVELIPLVDAFESYGGWGIKGSARSPKGLLYSAGGSAAISLTLHDGRRYLVGCDADDGDVRRVLEVLAPSPTDAGEEDPSSSTVGGRSV
ncbi:hypothetical protein MF406_04975 [Georgenia sp. TF02-10]|uniref:hypothetical protein n=1 Tax=Georgenia sp. TF02-10 TaxID=2917725 RepID=UPI001FA6AD9F|nr:hypothetical protein [Georgenia sp. TF02-10]UNX55615.1 hypothetical protein MF406_04975 [Georgenia sp. TF02-10]